MELDHVFLFTELPEQVANALHKFGLTEGKPNIHPGQGTSCRRFFFENAYLELAWVSSIEEIKNPTIADTKLWERSQYQLTHYCPFGICFRSTGEGKSAALVFEDGWKYAPPYLPEGMYANIASNTNRPAEPMLFEMPFFGVAPRNYPPEELQPLNHKNGFKEITKVILTLPAAVDDLSPAMQKVLDNSIVTMCPGGDFSVTLEFDHCRTGEAQDFKHLVPLSVKW